MDGRIGARLGRYEISGLVGRGGMATVYRAHDPALDRDVAIKLLHPHLAEDDAFVGRFRHEAQAIAALRHPNIVRVFDIGAENNDYYMVMEFIDGGTLADVLRETKGQGAGLPPQDVVRIVTPLCSAIDYAAGQGMIHRDIKPSNIMLTKAGDPILTDYGIAKMLGVTSFTASGMVMGSAHYMAPEQAQGLEADVRTDIYALGVVTFQALTGRVPFDADTTGSVLAQHIVAPLPSLSSLNPALSPAVQWVLEKALAKDPVARYRTAADFAADLGAALTELPTAAGAAATVGVTTAGTSPNRAAPTLADTRLEPLPKQPSGAPVTPAPAAPTLPSEPQMAPYPYVGWEQPARPGLSERLRRRPVLLAAGGVVAVAAILAAVLGTRTGGSTTTTGTQPISSAVSSIVSVISTAPFMTTGSSSPSTSTLVTDVSPQTAALRAEADTLMMAGRFNEAAAKYTEALGIDPDDAAARSGLGIAYYHAPKSPKLGAQQLETAVVLDPGSVRAWSYLGACRYLATAMNDGQDYSSAREACNRALELDPNSGLAHAFLARIYSAEERPEDAASEAATAVRLAPSEPEVLVAMGDVKSDTDDWQDALTYYKRASTLAPNYPHYLLNLATAYRETEQYDTAIEYCRNALQLDEGYEYAAYRGIGRALWEKGDYEGAKSNLQKAISLDDTDAMSHWALGGVYYDQDDYDASLPELERAVAIRPNNAGMLAWLGACYMALERWAEARTALEKALELDPGRTDAQDRLDELTAAGH
jgi:serine/threonine protein kinase/tetratricopeptide (TPR) repeat protein